MAEINLWSQLITGGVGLVGALVGGWVTYKTQTYLKIQDREVQRNNLAVAIAAEIEAYLDLMELREHEKYALEIIKLNKNGTKTLPKAWLSGFEKENDPFPVLAANLTEVGTLGDSCADLAKFYNRVVAVRTTLACVDEGAYDDAVAADVAHIMETELKVWKNAVLLGRSVVSSLRNLT